MSKRIEKRASLYICVCIHIVFRVHELCIFVVHICMASFHKHQWMLVRSKLSPDTY